MKTPNRWMLVKAHPAADEQQVLAVGELDSLAVLLGELEASRVIGILRGEVIADPQDHRLEYGVPPEVANDLFAPVELPPVGGLPFGDALETYHRLDLAKYAGLMVAVDDESGWGDDPSEYDTSVPVKPGAGAWWFRLNE